MLDAIGISLDLEAENEGRFFSVESLPRGGKQIQPKCDDF
jgi:hypothetical protein